MRPSRLGRATLPAALAGIYLFTLSALWMRSAPDTRPGRMQPVQISATPQPGGAFPVRVWALDPGVNEVSPVLVGGEARAEVAPGVWRVPRMSQLDPLVVRVSGMPERRLTLPVSPPPLDDGPTLAPSAPLSLVARPSLPASLETRVAVVVAAPNEAQLVRLEAEGASVTPTEANTNAAGVAWFRVRAERPTVRLQAIAGALRVRRTMAVEGQPVSIVAVEQRAGGRRVRLARASASAPVYCDLFEQGSLVDAWTLLAGVEVLDVPTPVGATQRLQCTAVLGDPSARGDATWLAPEAGAVADEALWSPAPLRPLAVSSSSLADELRADQEARGTRRTRFLVVIGLSFVLIAGVAIARGLRSAKRSRARLEEAVAQYGDPDLAEGPAASLVRRRSRVELVGMSLVLLLALAALLGLFERF